MIFFAYVGFEAVSTAAAEARNPKRDVPIGIITSLAICTVVYLAVAAVMVGVVPFRQLGVADPLAIAVDAMHQPWLALFVKVGAVTGLLSVMLVLQYGQSRIFFTMARDGLLPRVFCVLHRHFRTPWLGTILLGAGIAAATALLPIDIISDLVSLGTTTAFGIVCFTVIWQRNACPDLKPPFPVPFGAVRVRGIWIGVVPVLGIVFALVMAVPLLIDIVRALLNHDPIPALLLLAYVVVGALCYVLYGYGHSGWRPTPRRPSWTDAAMLIRRIAVIAILMLAGFVILTISVWTLAFNANSSNLPVSNGHWWLERLPILIGLLLVVAGFAVLSRTRVARPLDEVDYEDPAA